MAALGHVKFAVFICLSLLTFIYSDQGKHSRFEYKHSFKGPHLVNKQGKVPFWNHYGSAIPSEDQIRITPSLKDQKGGLWAKTVTEKEFWEVEVFLKISGRGRVGGDGTAVWFTEDAGHPGPVFGSADKWKGMGLFFDSFDNDGEQNNPYIMVMVNDGTKAYDHHKDGIHQQLGGCMRDFRNRPYPVRVKIRYYNNILTVFYHGGMSNRDEDYELCMRAENVQLPKQGIYGVTAATGGLADDHDVIKFLTHSLTPPLSSEEQKKKQLTEEQRKKFEDQYEQNVKKLDDQKEEFQKAHPEQKEKKQAEEKYESVYERDVRLMYEAANAIHQLVMKLHGKTGELAKEVNTLHSVVSDGKGKDQGDGSIRQEMNTLISLQNQIHSIVKEQQERRSAGQDTNVLNNIESNIRTVLENVSHLVTSAQLKNTPPLPPSTPACPTVNCVSTSTLLMCMALQLFVGFGYMIYKGHQDQAAKKFY